MEKLGIQIKKEKLDSAGAITAPTLPSLPAAEGGAKPLAAPPPPADIPSLIEAQNMVTSPQAEAAGKRPAASAVLSPPPPPQVVTSFTAAMQESPYWKERHAAPLASPTGGGGRCGYARYGRGRETPPPPKSGRSPSGQEPPGRYWKGRVPTPGAQGREQKGWRGRDAHSWRGGEEARPTRREVARPARPEVAKKGKASRSSSSFVDNLKVKNY